MFRLLLAAALFAFAGPAFADGAITKLITKADATRLANYEATRADALKEAREGGDKSEVAALNALLATKPQPFKDFDLTGNWQCRTIKLGGNLPLVIYGWFKCRVTDDGSGWFLAKTNGSQRTQGRFYTDSDTRLTYLGTQFVNDEKPKPYGAGSETDQVGYVYRTGNSFRIELPAPFYESKLDILELRR